MITTLLQVALSAILGITGSSSPVSTFDKNNDGWTLGTYASSDFTGAYRSFGKAAWMPKGGNPGGCAYCNDVESDTDTFFVAPKKFLGTQSAYYGGNLSYDLNDTDGAESNQTAAVVLKGGGLTICYASKQLPATKPNKFTHFSIPLREKGWSKDKYHGTNVSAADFKRILSNVTELSIRSEYHSGPEDNHLDNVRYTTVHKKAQKKKAAKK